MACRMPLICWGLILAAASLNGSSVISSRSDEPPTASTLATPAMPSNSGTTSSRTREPTSAVPFDWMVNDRMGKALMLSVVTRGDTPKGRPAERRLPSMSATAALMSVP